MLQGFKAHLKKITMRHDKPWSTAIFTTPTCDFILNFNKQQTKKHYAKLKEKNNYKITNVRLHQPIHLTNKYITLICIPKTKFISTENNFTEENSDDEVSFGLQHARILQQQNGKFILYFPEQISKKRK